MCYDMQRSETHGTTGALATPSATASRKNRGKPHCCAMRRSQLKQIKAHLTPLPKQRPVQHTTTAEIHYLVTQKSNNRQAMNLQIALGLFCLIGSFHLAQGMTTAMGAAQGVRLLPHSMALRFHLF